MPSLSHVLSYRAASELVRDAGGAALFLATDRENRSAPLFLDARALQPDVTASALRAVSEIVAARFYVPPAMLGRILREADPVATVGHDAVRFEGFSSCCSAYIRLDMDDAALDCAQRGLGTTNVDFGDDLRAALAQVGRDTPLGISIGAQSVSIEREKTRVTERKVPLPIRWLKGFADVQNHMAGMTHAFTAPRVPAQRFLRAMPRSKTDHLQFISLAAHSLRRTTRKAPGAVPLRGGHRLHVLEPLLPMARDMQVYVNAELGSSAWMLDFGAQRLCLVLNAEPWRGFSGDGGLLSALASEEASIAALRAQLHWQSRITPDELGKAAGVSADAARVGIAQLAASGLIGFDLSRNAWFHRVLPFDMERIERLNPRLRDARALVDAGKVTIGSDTKSAQVASGDVVHRITLTDGVARCTCPWFSSTKGARGPCKHVLAAQIALEGEA